jgi:hypothetical protein
MTDSLRSILPLQEPYSIAPYFKSTILIPSGEVITPYILSVSGNNAIVDWIYLEFRSGLNPAVVVASRRALLQRDGDIVSHIDGVSPVTLPGLMPGSYYVSVKHRNHLGIMSATPVNIANCAVNNVDFTSTPLWNNSVITTNGPAKIINAKNVMWSCDANTNKNIKYNGLNSDKDQILNMIGGSSGINNVVTGYRSEDINMDGKIKYNGVDNDRVIILENVGTTTPNAIIYQHSPN